MPTLPLVPTSGRLELRSLALEGGNILLTVRTCGDHAVCPRCGQPSARMHSHYHRTLADLPWAGIPTHISLWSRRFFCDRADCPRRVFTERLLGVAAPHARRTDRLRDWLVHTALALCGKPGARLLHQLGIPVCGSTLLSYLRAQAFPARPTPRGLVREWSPSGPASQMEEWLAKARASQMPELAAFAVKLRHNLEAVLASFTLPSSQGQTEGQVNRLKLLKRSMYGACMGRQNWTFCGSECSRTSWASAKEAWTWPHHADLVPDVSEGWLSTAAVHRRCPPPLYHILRREQRPEALEMVMPRLPSTTSVHQLLGRATIAGQHQLVTTPIFRRVTV